jgi:hypothetical protein
LYWQLARGSWGPRQQALPWPPRGRPPPARPPARRLRRALGIPVGEVQVQWTEMPGSKIRFTSILHMAWELLTLKAAYQWLGAWPVASEAQLARKVQ